MKRMLLLCMALTAMLLPTSAQDAEPLVQFDFQSATDLSNTYTGKLFSGAEFISYSDRKVLSLGNEDGYFDFGEQFGDVIASLTGNYTISVNVFLPEDIDLAQAGNFIWCFARSASEGYLFLGANDPRFAITLSDYTAELSLTGKKALEKGRWNNIIVLNREQTVRLYVNGVSASKVMRMQPSQLGKTVQNYLGRSCYATDQYLRGAMYSDFRIYDTDLRTLAVSQLAQTVKPLNAYEDQQRINQQMNAFSLGDVSQLKEDIVLPTTYEEIAIAWESSDNGVITADGHITRPVAGNPIAHATLTAHLSAINPQLSEETMDRTFEVGVLPELSDEDMVAADMLALTIPGHPNNVYTDLVLPTVAPEGSIVFWKSADPDWITDEGRVVRLPEDGKRQVKLTATIVKNKVRQTRDFTVTLHEKEPYTNYLFVYFPSNSDENLYYALSNDGYNFTPINNGRRVVAADSIALKKGVRDPHILRGPDGMFYMVNTDMRCAEGWESNRGLVMMKSPDLIHWTHSTVHFPDKYRGTMFEKVIRVWAPETIWDDEAQKFMVYFSLRTKEKDGIPYDKDYYCYANEDFTDLEGEPVYFYDRGSATIDMDIVYNESDGLYHGFYKNEGSGGICKVTAKYLTARPGEEPGSQWSAPSGTLQQTNEAVEGAGVFKLINQDSWILMYDCYTSGHYQFCSSPDLSNFTFVQNTRTSGAFTPRHGTVLPITEAETAALLKAFPVSGIEPVILGARNTHIRQTQVENSASDAEGVDFTMLLPVDNSADLSRFDPQLYATAGSIVSPTGLQDFTQTGYVDYTVASSGQQKVWRVMLARRNNPVLPDFHADPEVIFSRKTGRFYIYPTTDGYTGWGGYSFDVFSSPDLVSFTNEGTILNLQRGNDVAWASGNAWAPSIEEKFMNGKWRYYFYFSGQNQSLGKKTLGVAVSDSPTGPFKASASPLFTSSQAGQMIDSDVFTDPVSGQAYLYYGNGQLCYRLLSDDMLSVEGTEYVITPSGGSLSDYAFREGVNVFYRNGLYYFLWSVDDTGAKNYHVAYGTSTSPTGPIKVARQPIVIIQDAGKEIYGTGHNSVVNVPGTDDWYIVYHRINKGYLQDGPGYHREVCVDKLQFASDGTSIVKTVPTIEGISPVTVENLDDIISAVREVPVTEEAAEAADGKAVYFSSDGRSLGCQAPVRPGLYIRQETLPGGKRRNMKMVVK